MDDETQSYLDTGYFRIRPLDGSSSGPEYGPCRRCKCSFAEWDGLCYLCRQVLAGKTVRFEVIRP